MKEFLKKWFLCDRQAVTTTTMACIAVLCFTPAFALEGQHDAATFQNLETPVAVVDSTPAGDAVTKPASEDSPQPGAAASEKPVQQAEPPQPQVQPEISDRKPEVKSPAPDQKRSKKNGQKSSESVQSKGEDAGALIRQAAECAKRDEYADALQKYKSALKKLSGSPDQKLLAAALSGTARALHRMGQDGEALENIHRAIAVHQNLRNAQARSLDYLLAGRILMGQEHYAEALKFFEEAIKILPNSESAEQPKLLEDTAACQLRLHKLPESLNTYNRLLGLFIKNGDDRESARLYLIIGEIQISRSDSKSARVNFRKAEKIYRDLNLQKELGETLFRLAYVEQNLGDSVSAKNCMEEARSVLGGGQSETGALPLMVKGIADFNDGKLSQAAQSLNAALTGYEQSGDRTMAARVRLVISHLEIDRASLTAALELATKSLEEFRTLSSPAGETAALLVIGDVYFRQGFVQKALEYSQDALVSAKKVNDRNQMVQSRILLADIYAGFGDPETASKFLKEAVEDVKTNENRLLKAQLKLAIARFRLSRESSEKALQDAEDARKDFEASHNRRGVADCNHLMGLALELRGEREKAFSFL
ncbi:MAG TPA: tetratricopeptide repeat protein, partial [Desulfomonilaceae bacterium]|nr:tetratricopeptide repeat protein [Desulfomonilaceae bacterium]